MSIQLVMPSHHLILCRRLLLLPSDFPSIGVFLVSQLFSSGSQRLGASASALPLAGEAKQEVESQCAGPGRAYGAAAAVSSEIQEQDSPMCKVASDRPSLSDHHPGLILRLWPERPVSSVGNLAGLRDCLTPVRGPLEMRAEQASARCSRNPGAGLQTLAVGAGTHTEAGGRGGRAERAGFRAPNFRRAWSTFRSRALGEGLRADPEVTQYRRVSFLRLSVKLLYGLAWRIYSQA